MNQTENMMRELEMKPFVKYVVLKVDLFETEIIDEQNFTYEDKVGIMKFKRKYNRADEYMIVKIDM